MENYTSQPLLNVEVVATSLRSCAAAQMAGANRIELCSALSTAGLTPSAGLIQSVKKHIDIPVYVFVRPREGNFVYDRLEEEVVLRDIEAALLMGADGIVFGALDIDGNIDLALMKKVMAVCQETPVTFHRAFDLCPNKAQALEDLISLGIKRVLTSGGANTCIAGKKVIHDLVMQAKERIKIMPGSGLTAENVHEVIHSDITDFHLSGRELVENTSLESSIFELNWHETSVEKIHAMVQSLNQLVLANR